MEIPLRTRDPLLVRRELPCFGLNSGFPRTKRTSDVSTAVQSVSNTRPSTQVSEEERFQPYERAARRNYILSRASNRYQLTASPIQPSVVETSVYPEAELTPELRRKQGAIVAYKSLRKFEVRSQTPVMQKERGRTAQGGKTRPRHPDSFDKDLEAIHRNLDTAYRSSLPKPCSFISSHSEFLRKSTSPIYDHPPPSIPKSKPTPKPSNDQTLSGEEILTILTCYKEEQQASRLMREEEKKEEGDREGEIRTPETRKGPVCRVVELTGIQDKSASNFYRPKSLLDRPHFSRFKLPVSTSGLHIEVHSNFMQIQPASLSPKRL